MVAFIPGDQLLSAAYESDPTLQEHAMANGVLLTTPTMLIALLRTVAFGWRQESLAENAREVQRLGAEMYERLRTMSAHMQRLQRSLTASVSAYNDAVGSLESRVLVSARRFPALGVVGVETEEIADLPPVDASPRLLQAMELVADVPEDVVMLTPARHERGHTPPRRDRAQRARRPPVPSSRSTRITRPGVRLGSGVEPPARRSDRSVTAQGAHRSRPTMWRPLAATVRGSRDVV